MLILLGILMLIGLVIFHELGHFWAARRAGIEVEEFGIGFPPKAKTIAKKNGTEYTLNWLPLGGFVKLKGESDSATEKGSFGAAKLSDKIKVMVAGVIMNIFAALFILTIVAAVGLPKVLDNQFTVASDTKISKQYIIAGFVGEGSPAEQAGVEAGDIIRSIEQKSDCVADCDLFSFTESSQLSVATKSLAGKEVTISYEKRNGETKIAETKLLGTEEVEASKNSDDPKGYLGVVPSDYSETRSTWSAPIVATVFSGQVVQETFKSFGSIFKDLSKGDASTAKEQVTGVVGIGYILSELSSQGFISILFLTGIISLSLAIMNILPIPALDGGRLFVTLLFRALKRPLTKETEERIHGTGFALLMLLFVLITIVDVQRFIIN